MKNPTWRVINRNQQNAQHSTGPKSEEGKAKSSLNATKHSLTSKQTVIPGEDPAEYDAHRAALVADLKPANSLESDLVEELAVNSWRLKRAHRIETAVLTEIARNSPDPDAAIAKSFLERPKELERLVRYMTSIERAYWRVFNKLAEVQKARRQQQRQKLMEQSYLQSSGFVSQPAETPSSEPARAVAAGQSMHNTTIDPDLGKVA